MDDIKMTKICSAEMVSNNIIKKYKSGLEKKTNNINRIINLVEGDNLPDIMNFPNGIINSNETSKFNNILYYDENLNFSESIYKDSDNFEACTLGAFILCTNLISLKLVQNEILREFQKDHRIIFNLITTGSKCETIMDLLKENKVFDNCIQNVSVYCMNLKKYQYLKEKYPKIHNDIYNDPKDIIEFINKYSNENIKSFPITKLISINEYKEKYKDRHLKIAEFYGDYTQNTFKSEIKKMKFIIDKEDKQHELKNKNKSELLEGFLTFDINKDLDLLDNLIIKEYTKNTFYGDLNKWLMNSKLNYYEPIAYFTSRLMYSLNSYATKYNKYYQEENILYRGIKLPYTCLLPYERAKGKIIILTSFTSTSEDEKITSFFSGRENSKEQYETHLLFSVLFIIQNKWKKKWISNGINLMDESEYKEEKEILYQPFSFYYVKDVKINHENYTADIYLETIGRIKF